MQPSPTRPSASGFVGYVSEHRFGLTLLACALALVLMLAVVHGTIGLGPIWARFAAPAA